MSGAQWGRALGNLLVGMSCAAVLGAHVVAAEDASPTPPADAPAPATIKDGVKVQLEYTLKADGGVVDSTEGREPFSYVHGQGQIVPGLERQLAGLHVGDQREITVSPEEGYGAIDPEAFVDVPKQQLPSTMTPQVGMMLQGKDPQGRAFRATIHKISGDTVTLDLNHPLAGKTLLFNVKVVNIAPAS